MVSSCRGHVLFGFQEHIIKMQKQKMQLPPQPPPPQAQPGPPQQPAQVQVQTPQPPQQQQSPQLTTVTAPRPGALLTGTTVANLQVARLVSSSSHKYHLCISPKLFCFYYLGWWGDVYLGWKLCRVDFLPFLQEL